MKPKPENYLCFAPDDSWAWAKDQKINCEYGDNYFAHYKQLEGTEIAKRLNDLRWGMCKRHLGKNATVIDIGIGSGEFLASGKDNGIPSFGYDVCPQARRWLEQHDKWIDIWGHGIRVPPKTQIGWCLWDVFEHLTLAQQADYLDLPIRGDYLFLSLPIFASLGVQLEKSKHYKPGEHLSYFTRRGLVAVIERSGYVLVAHNQKESEAGRQNIESFAFVKFR